MKNLQKEKNNKSGFTLIELLAVIVILAIIIMVAASNVGGVTQTARKNVLAVEGASAIDAAKEAYQLAVLEGNVTTGDACFSLQYLYDEGYYSKGSADDKYQGSVLVSTTDGKVYTYKYWISDGNYTISEATTEDKAADKAKKWSDSEGGDASETCGDNTTATMFKAS
jgi:prepilin-type N-terminal cleavage/methylation domain-containing protein